MRTDSEERDLASRSLAEFGVKSTALRRISRGLDRSYRVPATDGNVFALRVSSGAEIRRVSAFRVEAAWIESLADNPWFHVPALRHTVGGDIVAEVRDAAGIARASTLLTWLPGRGRSSINFQHALHLGRLSGALHISGSEQKTSNDDIKTWDAPLMCLMGMKDALHSFPRDAVTLVETVLARLDDLVTGFGPDDIGLINADVGLHNIVWHKSRPGFVDFNDSGIGPYAFCLARLVERIRRHDNGDALVDALLKGYREVTPLPLAYVNWGHLFEAAAAVFRFKFTTTRIQTRGTDLTDSEHQTVTRWKNRL